MRGWPGALFVVGMVIIGARARWVPTGAAAPPAADAPAQACPTPGAPGQRMWGLAVDGAVRGAPAIAADGTVFVGTESGQLIAIATESHGLDPESAWPAFRHDVRNTGRAGP